MRLARFCIALFIAALLAGCSMYGGWNTQVYRVRSGDTLYAIAWRYHLDLKDLAAWNNIASPYTIFPGQELILTDPKYLPDDRRPAAGSVAQAKKPSKKAGKSRSVSKKPAGPPPKDFRWPTSGEVVRSFDGRKSGSQGIDIAGKLGQPVQAAAAGKVVYSGDGLVGFGNLVIVKHNEDYLSAYAYNQSLRVKEGEYVKAGQTIADMGFMQQGKPRLHFEIRRQGKPVNPLKYLPKR